MTIATQTMTDEQRKTVALEYLKRLDTGGNFFELFADDIELYFPKWGVARNKKEAEKLFSEVGGILKAIKHDYAYFNYFVNGDTVIIEGTSSGTTASGVNWRAGVTHAGMFCDVFEVRDFKIQRLFIYLDPDYWGADTDRYPWLKGKK